MELFYSGIQEAVEVVEELRNSTLFIDHFLCQVYGILYFIAPTPPLGM